jgi:hypothetical protein
MESLQGQEYALELVPRNTDAVIRDGKEPLRGLFFNTDVDPARDLYPSILNCVTN